MDGLAKILPLKTFTYYFNDLARKIGLRGCYQRMVGMSAQEVRSVCPEAVQRVPGNEEYFMLKYERLIPLLIKALQEEVQKREELEKRVFILENK
jgi:hypothetical protein